MASKPSRDRGVFLGGKGLTDAEILRLDADLYDEAVALRSSEEVRRMLATDRINKIEVDLFTLLSVLVALIAIGSVAACCWFVYILMTFPSQVS